MLLRLNHPTCSKTRNKASAKLFRWRRKMRSIIYCSFSFDLLHEWCKEDFFTHDRYLCTILFCWKCGQSGQTWQQCHRLKKPGGKNHMAYPKKPYLPNAIWKQNTGLMYVHVHTPNWGRRKTLRRTQNHLAHNQNHWKGWEWAFWSIWRILPKRCEKFNFICHWHHGLEWSEISWGLSSSYKLLENNVLGGQTPHFTRVQRC